MRLYGGAAADSKGGRGQLFHRLSGVWWPSSDFRLTLQPCGGVAAPRAPAWTYTRVICFRQDRSEVGIVHWLCGTVGGGPAAAATLLVRQIGFPRAPRLPRGPPAASSPRPRARSGLPLPLPRSPLLAPWSHLTHAATPSTGEVERSAAPQLVITPRPSHRVRGAVLRRGPRPAAS